MVRKKRIIISLFIIVYNASEETGLVKVRKKNDKEVGIRPKFLIPSELSSPGYSSIRTQGVMGYKFKVTSGIQ